MNRDEREVICRVLKIQKRKTVTFIYVSGGGLDQLMVDNLMFDSITINRYDIIKVRISLLKNHKGNNVYAVRKIEVVGERSRLGTNSFRYSISNNCNKKRECKNRVIEELDEYLKNIGYKKYYEPITTRYRGVSQASPLKVKGQYVTSYLRLTHEMNLKREVCCTLKPSFEIGYVARDVYFQQYGSPEYLSLETVAPFFKADHILETFIFLMQKSCQIADDLNVDHAPLSDVEVVRYDEIGKKVTDRNIIYLDAPVSSPFVKCIEGKRTEIRWEYHNQSIGHGYLDENSYDKVYCYFMEQMEYLLQKGIQAELSRDFLEVLRIGMPDTVSMGIGLDRFFCVFFQYSSMKDYFNDLFGVYS